MEEKKGKIRAAGEKKLDGLGRRGVQTQDDRWWKLNEGGRQLGRVTLQGEGKEKLLKRRTRRQNKKFKAVKMADMFFFLPLFFLAMLFSA